MAILNAGSFFVNTDNVVTMNIIEEDEGVILKVESDHMVDETFIPDVTVEQAAAAIRHGLRLENVIVNLEAQIEKIKRYRGETNDEAGSDSRIY